MVLRVIGGLVVGGFATYGVVKLAEATGIFSGLDFARGEVGYEPLESTDLGESGTEEGQQAVRHPVPLM